MRGRSASVAVLAFSLSAFPALAADRAGTEPQPRAAAAEQRTANAAAPASRAQGTQADIARYSERQAASPQAKNYEGGDSTVVIGASTATIVLAIVLLVVLL